MNTQHPPTYTLSPDGARAVLTGSWTFGHYQMLTDQIRSSPRLTSVDGSGVEALDTTGALLLVRIIGERKVVLEGFPADEMAIFELVRDRLKLDGSLRLREHGYLELLGRKTVEILLDLKELLAFVGNTFSELFKVVLRPRLFRTKEFFVHLEQSCVLAVPIVSLVMFLIGVVLAYLSSIQAEKFGANIFVVDAVALATCRELSPVIVAIIVAGRSGSAFTAHIGAMKLNEEIDAMTTMGLTAERVLIIPRMLALIVALPILVFVGDVVGILGGMFVADLRLDITGPTFLQRLQSVLPLRSFMVGLIKAPVFAVFIAIIGCKMGLTVQNNARALGLSTTSTVVQSIVSVILLNAAFAIIFQELGI